VPAAPPEAHALAGQLDAVLGELAGAARDHRAPTGLPPLRQTQQALAARVGRSAPVVEETDRMVNSVEIAAHVLTAPAIDTRASITATPVSTPAPARG
jgi:hypothetical protein